MPPYTSLAVANFFIERANQGSGQGVDPLKLQKLLYYAHGWHLAIAGLPLLDEPIEAWTYGPVVPTVYHEFKAYGREPIDLAGYCYDYVTDDRTKPLVPTEDGDTLDLLERIWKAYGAFSGTQLSAMTHAPNSPWAKTRERGRAQGQLNGVDIPNEDIKAHFVEMALKTRRSSPLATA